MMALRLWLPTAAIAWCASGLGQVPPTAAEYAAYTGIFAAAARNDTTRITRLIASGEYPGVRDHHGRTPLHVAAYKRRHDAMRVLAAATGDPNVVDADGYDIATIAAAAGDPDTLRVALAIGCSPRNVAAADRGTALIAAARRGSEPSVRLLARAGAPIDHVNKASETALIAAIAHGDGSRRYAATVKTLIAARADVNLADRGGASPLALARSRGQREIAAMLESAGAR